MCKIKNKIKSQKTNKTEYKYYIYINHKRD